MWHTPVFAPVYGLQAPLLSMPVSLRTVTNLLYTLYLWVRIIVSSHTGDKQSPGATPFVSSLCADCYRFSVYSVRLLAYLPSRAPVGRYSPVITVYICASQLEYATVDCHTLGRYHDIFSFLRVQVSTVSPAVLATLFLCYRYGFFLFILPLFPLRLSRLHSFFTVLRLLMLNIQLYYKHRNSKTSLPAIWNRNSAWPVVFLSMF